MKVRVKDKTGDSMMDVQLPDIFRKVFDDVTVKGGGTSRLVDLWAVEEAARKIDLNSSVFKGKGEGENVELVVYCTRMQQATLTDEFLVQFERTSRSPGGKMAGAGESIESCTVPVSRWRRS